MSKQKRCSDKIAELNDLARTAMGVASRVFQTDAVSALEPEMQSRIREAVENFTDFSEDNNPYGERDFGSFSIEGERFFWKIDYYDKTLQFGSPDPSDPAVTTRVLTIGFISDY